MSYLKHLKEMGFIVFIKWAVIVVLQKIRVFFYKTISLNKPQLLHCKLYQPVYFLGKGSIQAARVNFGVFVSPFFLSGYSYIEARGSTASIRIGEHTSINNNAVIIADKTSITIGSSCLIGAHFTVFDSDFHGLAADERQSDHYETAAVVIANNVFIGNNVTITKGVTVGENAVIGVGAVVTQDVPANSIYAGNPAKFIKAI